MILIDYLLLLVLVISTLNWWPSRYWLFEISGYFSQQFFILLIALSSIRLFLFETLTFSSTLLLFLSLLVAIIHLRKIVPYTRFAKVEVPNASPGQQGHKLSLIVANIYQFNRQYHRFVDLISDHQVDVIVLLETDHKWIRYLQANLDRSAFPFEICQPQSDTYGLAVFSRFKIHKAKVGEITDVPSLHTIIEDQAGAKISLFVVHPKPPVLGEAETSWPKDRELLGVASQISDSESQRIIVTGDLNEVAWSRTSTRFLEKTGLMDPRRGRRILNTFPAYFPLLGFPLDHFYCSRHFKIIQYRRLRNIGSDHFPLLISFLYE